MNLEYRQLSKRKVIILNIPSESALILLATQLYSTANKLLNNEIKSNKGLYFKDYIYKAISIIKIVDDYSNKYISYKEFKNIKKEFSIVNM